MFFVDALLTNVYHTREIAAVMPQLVNTLGFVRLFSDKGFIKAIYFNFRSP